jgi:flagellar biosynthesis protein FlhG
MNHAEIINSTFFTEKDQHYPGKSSPLIISVSSAKGGVGKTSIVVNVAHVLSLMDKKVLIFDADLGLSNVDVMLGLTPKDTIKDVLSLQKKFSDIMVNGPNNIKIIPASSGISELQSLNDSEKIFIVQALQELLNDFDIILIDNSAGIASNVIYFNLTAHLRLIVITPDITSLVDAYSLIKILSMEHDIKKFSIVVNQVKDNNEAKKIFRHMTSVSDKFLGPLSFSYLGYVPKDDSVPKSIFQQKTVIELFPKSSATRGFNDISRNILKCSEISETEFSLIYNNFI